MNFTLIMAIGSITTSVLVAAAFLFGLGLVYIHGDESGKSLYTGAVIANFTTAVGFWLGSSACSQKKDERQTPPAA